jgi:hypothetical protein
MNADEYMRRLQWGIADLYKNHELLDEQYWFDGSGARWLIGRPGTGVMLTEIIAGVHGSLVVHGDCDLSRFAYYSDYRDAWNRLCWMGRCQDVGYYVAQKASIGMGRSGGGKEYDERVARHELERYVAELRGEDLQHRNQDELIEVLTDALEHVEDEHELRSFLYQNDKGWDLWEHTFGRVVATPVITGHLALQRCAHLLLTKYGEEGPPACRARGHDG